MLQKIQKKLWNVKCTVDELIQENDIFRIRGWIFSEQSKIDGFKIIIRENGRNHLIDGKYKLKRTDVYQSFHCENAKKCGFFAQAFVENMKEYTVWVMFSMRGKKYELYVGKIKNREFIQRTMPARVTEIDTSNQGIDIVELLDEQKAYEFHFPKEYESQCVDIIIPVYNGYIYLDKLLESVSKTRLNYRLILLNDRSTDSRVLPLLEAYAKDRDNVILLNNQENLGFLKTVNRGFEMSTNHIALVNTDVELPEMWLERLMLPIFQNEKIASSTPYTNSGTICSFPEFGKDNKLFMGLNVQEIDSEFLKIPPRYTEIPTGVGFCMGINKNVLDEVGVFDAESFGMGYGEENDWCQRALERGYKNVQVENLFVYHNHGGSFLSEDKKRFLEEHEKILLRKHPYYNKDVARFCSLDPNREIRELVKINLLVRNTNNTILAFDHNLGGGASSYLTGKKDEALREDDAFIIVRYDYVDGCYRVCYYYKNQTVDICVKKREDIIKIMDHFSINEIWVNELVTYPEIYQTLTDIRHYSEQNSVNVKMLMHDYYSVCPTINMLGCNGKYCNIPEYGVCDECLKNAKSLQTLEYGSMLKWRKEWKCFMASCHEVVVFSNNSKEIVEKAFGKMNNISVCPHQIEYIPKLEKKYKTTNTINIGLLGRLTKHKGRTLVSQISQIIEKKGLNIRIILIGSASKEIKSSVYKETGAYSRDSIPRLVLENDIDVFLIPSIWPETFSYTTEEIIKMDMPIMCFDIGAPAERVRKYNKGIVIPEISAEAVLKVVQDDSNLKKYTTQPNIEKSVLFVVEEITFSSRYRVDHLREQLLQKGISSECITVEETKKHKLNGYSSIVVYRSSNEKYVRTLVKKAHQFGIKVYYDMDDYIFDYSSIKHLKFLEGEDYTDFENYSNNIRKSMELCDGYIVSTNNLKKAVEKDFPGKEIVINRNVASMEMLTLSLSAHKESNGEKIRLGYFSGSKTHNEDFEKIKHEILTIMEKNENVYLMVGGQIELPSDFNAVKNRIEKFEFVSWKKLPYLISQADINLMPLEDTFFHACKSENKWMESALVKVPTVATWNNELERAIEDGVNGYLCRQPVEWEEKLQYLIDHKEKRTEIAENAHRKVLQRYTTFSIEPEVIHLLTGDSGN